MIKKFNIIIALFLIFGNIYFLYILIFLIYAGFGTFGYGLLIVPFIIFALLFLIPSISVLKKENHENPVLLLINFVGATYFIFLFIFFLI